MSQLSDLSATGLFTLITVIVLAALALAGLVRLVTRARAGLLHLLTLANASAALAILALQYMGVQLGFFTVLGLIGGVSALGFWALGAALARARPIWVDLCVILSMIALFASYAGIAEHDGRVPALFSTGNATL